MRLRGPSLGVIITVLSHIGFIHAQSASISIDGIFDDWENLNMQVIDPTGDGGNTGIDFKGLKTANDSIFLYMQIDVGLEINIQGGNDITLYLDTDNDSSTGYVIGNIGAELRWNFGARSGMVFFDMDSTGIGQVDIRIRTAPTVSSGVFELCIGRSVKPDGSTSLFQGDSIGILFRDDSPGGDMMPDIGEYNTYVFDPTPIDPPVRIGLHREGNGHLRLLTWNVERDGFFSGDRYSAYSHILQAIIPDIICFQEIYDHDAIQTKERLELILPSAAGEEWYTSKAGGDIVLASRFPIIGSWTPNSPNGAFLVRLRPEYGKDLFIINAHPPCCGNNAGRQDEIDGMMAFLRDAKSVGGVLDLEDGTPIVIAGDMNLVGNRQQLETLLTGDIQDTSTYGPDFYPDWDDSDLTDATNRHTDLRQTYTWRNDGSSYSPGRLDYIIFSDSEIEMAKGLVLWTGELSSDTLTYYGMNQFDTRIASDHLPVLVDFILDKYNLTAELSLSATFINEGDTLNAISEISNPDSLQLDVWFTYEKEDGTEPVKRRMWDDGLHSDGEAGDGIFGADILWDSLEEVNFDAGLEFVIDDSSTLNVDHMVKFTSIGPLIFQGIVTMSGDDYLLVGESNNFKIKLFNDGDSASAEDVTAVLKTKYPGVVIDVPESGFGVIDHQTEKISDEQYGVTISDTMDTTHGISFMVEIASGGEIFWTDSFAVRLEYVGIIGDETAIPDEFRFHQNYPNPFNSFTVFTFELPGPGDALLEIFDITGKNVVTFLAMEYNPGRNVIKWESAGQSSGIYIARLTFGKLSQSRKILLLK